MRRRQPRFARAGALGLALVALAFGFPATADADSDFESALAYLAETSEDFLATADGLTADQLRFKPTPDSWSILEIAEHLVKVEGEVRRRLADEIATSPPHPEWREGVPRTTDRAIRLAMANRTTERFQAPEMLRPDATHRIDEAVLERFAQARQGTLEFVRTLPVDLRDHYGAHPLFGQIDGVQWLIFLGAHVERHRLQAEKVIASEGFPSASADASRLTHPVGAYLMADREEEVRLARTAAPAHVSDEATVYVMTSEGYELAESGSNPFVCLVLRGFTGPLANPDFWNPEVRGPVCYNEAAVRSALPADFLRTRLALSGSTKPELSAAQADAFRRGDLQPPASGAMAFMLSPEQLLGEAIGRWRPHLMIYVPHGSFDAWGARMRGAPALPFDGDGEPLTTMVVPVPAWSDGSEAPTG